MIRPSDNVSFLYIGSLNKRDNNMGLLFTYIEEKNDPKEEDKKDDEKDNAINQTLGAISLGVILLI